MGELGVTLPNLIIQILAFLLFIFLFWRFALGPITRTLDARQEKIRDSVQAADEMQKQLAETQSRNEQILAEARREAQEIIARAREVSDQNIARSVDQAQVQADEMIVKAREAIQAETVQARAELRRETVELALAAATKIIRSNLDRDAQMRLIEETLAEAGGQNGRTPGGA